MVSALSLIVSACGGENKAPDAVKDVAKNAVENVTEKATNKVAEAVGASAETAEKIADTAKTAVANVTANAVEGVDLKTEVASAKKTTKAFGGALKAELKKAMKAGGPLKALDVCNTEAMPITERVAKEQGATLSRVSLKNRNQDNVPNDWQKQF